jgi:hypothetical protein
MRLVGTESALCGTEEGRHCAGSVAGKERHAGRHQLVAGFSEEVRGLDVSVGGVLGSERSLGKLKRARTVAGRPIAYLLEEEEI